MRQKHPNNQAQTQTCQTRHSIRPASGMDSPLYLAVLFLSVAFFALLFSASAKVFGYGIESVSYSVAPSLQPKTEFERSLEKMVKDHPISDMTPFLARQDKVTAAYLVAIAKHESNWGKYSPKMDGKECYNYWGYRGQTEKVTRSGYSCFDSPKQAVSVVGKRLNHLIWKLELDTPEELLIWKCGSTCAGHDPSDVNRWARNVGVYSRKVGQEGRL